MDTICTGTVHQKKHQVVSWVLLAGLLLLRLPFFSSVYFFSQPTWVVPTYQIGTYLLTACLIYWERNRLAEFHIDKLALFIIILFPPIQTIIQSYLNLRYDPLTLPNWPSLLIWLISLGLVISLLVSRPTLTKISKYSVRWFGVGIVVGIITALFLGFPGSFQIDKDKLLSQSSLFAVIKEVPFYFLLQLGFAAVSEEPLFRGFLWGTLQKAGWNSVWIWLFQAVLFSIGHIYYLNRLPISFWVIVPVGALVLGGLVWRSKTISSSLAAHATLNALGNVVWQIIAYIRM